MRVDAEVIRPRLERLLSEVDEIERKLPNTVEAYGAPDGEGARYELEHRLFIALQAMLDTATHIAVAGGARSLDSYRDAFTALASLGIVDRELVDRLQGAPGLRNALAHEYLSVDDERVYRAMQQAGELRAFAASVWEWVERQ